MTLTDVLTLLAIIAGPCFGVFLALKMEDRRARKARQHYIFKTLMATRLHRLGINHIDALNNIDVEFDKNIPKEKAVVDCWKEYFETFDQSKMASPEMANTCFNKLLYEMSQALGYSLAKDEIRKPSYSPVFHGNIEKEDMQIRLGILEVLNGKRSLPVDITNVPQNKK